MYISRRVKRILVQVLVENPDRFWSFSGLTRHVIAKDPDMRFKEVLPIVVREMLVRVKRDFDVSLIKSGKNTWFYVLRFESI